MAAPLNRETYLHFLQTPPTLKDLVAAWPELWQEANADLAQLSGDFSANLQRYVDSARAQQERITASGLNPKVLETAFPGLIKARMLTLALSQYNLAARTKTTGGKISFDERNARLLQRLFFDGSGFVRKPVSLWQYFWTWPRVSQKNFLMPLVQKKGIYCFYSRPLIQKLAALARGQTCLEIAAGDGTLSRFLNNAGLDIKATDDHSWSSVIEYPAEVEQLDAAAALKKYRPQVVFCSWPAPSNPFEQAVFETPSVQLYVVLGSDGHSTGNRQAYAAQTTFELTDDKRLARLLLPRAASNSVLIFRRRPL